MNTRTLLMILIIVLIMGGGGYYGRGVLVLDVHDTRRHVMEFG